MLENFFAKICYWNVNAEHPQEGMMRVSVTNISYKRRSELYC